MSQLSGVFKSGGGGGTDIITIDGNVGFANGPIVTIKTTNEETLSFVGDDIHTLTLLTTDTNANLSLGTNALIANNGTALHNVAIGPIALDTLVSGDGNTALGYNAGGNYVGAESNNIVIGAGVLGTAAESNAIHIGDDGTRTTCFIGGINGVNVGSVARVVTEASNKLGTAIITAGTGITITPGANTITIAASGGGGITTIDGNTGSITGATVTIHSVGEGTFTTSGAGTVMNLAFTDANLNIGIGTNVLSNLSGGAANVIMGYIAGVGYTTGSRNVGLGYAALNADQTGDYNIGVGFGAGSNINGGNFNVLIGPNAGSAYNSTESNNIVLGNASSTGGESGVIHIGDGGNNTKFISGGIGGVNVGSTANVVTSSTTSTNGTQLGTAVITAGSGITVTPSANTITIAASGGSGITTINGNTGSITGATVTIESTGEGTATTSGAGTVMNLAFTDANSNVGIGTSSLAALAGGTANVVMGFHAGTAYTTGIRNVGLGYQALVTDQTGTGNVAVGFSAGDNFNGGNFNVLLGYQAGVQYGGTESNNIVIGDASAAGGENGAIRIGDGGVNTTFFAGGIGGVNVGATANVVTSSTASTNGTQLGTAVITAGTGITVTPGANTITIAASGTGLVSTLTGDTGGAISPTAGNINIQVGTARGTSQFAGSGSTLNLVYEDASHNLGFGALSLNALSGGSSNIAMGVNSGQAITSGQGNAALGVNTIGSVNTGSYNVALGNSVGGTMTTGSYNILLGRNAGSSYTSSESYNIAINAASTTVAAESNVLRIGDGTGTGTQQLNKAFISGITGIPVTGTAVLVSAGNQLGVAVSSRKYKENIQDMGDLSEKIMQLRPVSFNYKTDSSLQTGLIAEEVHEIMPQLVVYDQEGDPQTVKYHDLAALLLNEIQKLRKEVDELKRSR